MITQRLGSPEPLEWCADPVASFLRSCAWFGMLELVARADGVWEIRREGLPCAFGYERNEDRARLRAERVAHGMLEALS